MTMAPMFEHQSASDGAFCWPCGSRMVLDTTGTYICIWAKCPKRNEPRFSVTDAGKAALDATATGTRCGLTGPSPFVPRSEAERAEVVAICQHCYWQGHTDGKYGQDDSGVANAMVSPVAPAHTGHADTDALRELVNRNSGRELFERADMWIGTLARMISLVDELFAELKQRPSDEELHAQFVAWLSCYFADNLPHSPARAGSERVARIAAAMRSALHPGGIVVDDSAPIAG